MDESRRDRWEDVSEWPLTVAAVLFIAAYAWPILDTDLASRWVWACLAVSWVTWVAFAVDYVARLLLSRNRRNFVRRNLIDLAVVLLPLLRPLRLLRLVQLLKVLNRAAGSSLRGRVAVYVGGSTALILFVAALAVLDAEQEHPGANLTSFGDALWWAVTTVTTVGYGEHYPITATGRAVAVGLMLCGIALLGVVTASVASWLIDRVAEIEEESQAATRRDVHALHEEVAALRAEVARVRSPE